MSQDTTQPTPIDSAVYKRFKQFVKDNHGQIRGSLRSELETALTERMESTRGPDSIQRIEDDVAHIKAMLAETDADGGDPAPAPSEPNSTQTHRSTEKPHPKAPRTEKGAYLADIVREKHDSGRVATKHIHEIIQDEYCFAEKLTTDYTDRVLSRLGAEPHPVHGKVHVWGDALDDAREQLRDAADDDLEAVTETADPERDA